MSGLVLGWGYALILSPLIILAARPFAQQRLALWQIALFGVLGVFGGSTLVWWMGGWPFRNPDT